MGHQVRVSNELLMTLKSPVPVLDPVTDTVIVPLHFRDDVMAWLREHVTHPMCINCADVGVNGIIAIYLLFDDLSEATHFKLRWF